MAGFGRIFSLTNASTNTLGILSMSNSRSISVNAPLMGGARRNIMEKLGLPPRPSKPMTPFFKFMQVERRKISAENPHLKSPQVVKLVANQWITYDPKQKQVLQKEFETEMVAYSKQLMQYEQSITPEQKKMVAEAMEHRAEKREKFRMKKKIEELGRPKKPPTSFSQFLQEYKYAGGDNKPPPGAKNDWIRVMAEKWNAMNPEEKEKYSIEAKKLMQRYKDDVKEWEQKMVRMGHIDVVRNRGLIDLKLTKTE